MAMDIIRDPAPKKRKRILQASAGVVVIVLAVFGVQKLQPAAPSVDRSTVWTDTVQHGTMVRMVRGSGTLVPEQSRWITAVTSGRVDEILVLPGTDLGADAVFLRLSNPDVQLELLRAQQSLSQAESQLITLESEIERSRLSQAGQVASARARHLDAQRQYEINQTLYDRSPNLVAPAELARTREAAEEAATQLGLEEQRLAVYEESSVEQIRSQGNDVERLRAIVEFNDDRLASLEVVAGVGGVLTELPVEEGQWVTAGGTLARIVQPGRLKAEVRIPQTQARDIMLGQVAHVDTRNDTIQGQVSRINPAVSEGTVTIDVSLPDDLEGARPDMSVDGTVVIEQLDDVSYINRPAYGQAESSVGLFKLVGDGQYAERVTVMLGRSSVNEIEVREGLQPGDVVILSDMSQWDGFDRVRLR